MSVNPTGASFATASFETVRDALDRHVTAWNAMHRDACEATHVHGEQSSEVLDLRMTCLQDRLTEIRALTDVLTDANREVVTRAPEAVQGLGSLQRCADVAALRAVVRPPEDPAIRRAVDDVRTRLAEVKALTDAGRMKRALAIAPALLDDARKTHYLPVIAEASRRLGEVHLEAGDGVAAERADEEAVWAAEASRDDEIALEAAVQLIVNVGYYQARVRDAERWASFADALLQRLGPGHEILQSWRYNNLAIVYVGEGRPREALAMFEKAVALKEKVLGPRHIDVAISVGNVAMVLHDLGRFDESTAANQRALDIYRRTVGLQHPRAAQVLVNQAERLNERGLYVEARAYAQQALDVMEREFAPGHPDVAAALMAVGLAELGLDDTAHAVPRLEHALSISQATGGKPVHLGDVQFALARALWQARGHAERALHLATEAREGLAHLENGRARLAEVDAWLAQHRLGLQPISLR